MKVVGCNGEPIFVNPAVIPTDSVMELRRRVAKTLKKRVHQVKIICNAEVMEDKVTMDELPGGKDAVVSVMLGKAELAIAWMDTTGGPLEEVREIPLERGD
eukprot:CAMPEP_0115060406 /NCGR_PEP_ID=MMETSP0227-20121206/7447_1 /TAXON_ID=89957 /ORGANISM="Polarella glacialis, Strain CCMP 1383" /LENGTH=100 /DNA_ID=CAMNT_0002445619 /DNA_START=192 /DNA_END=491 /DNA_ORIENTATION=-